MTSLLEYDSTEFNLWGVFVLLPVTKAKIDMTKVHARKQNKIVLPPELNIPGEIISMRFKGIVRGIKRSENPGFFAHSIIMDIGAKGKTMALKLSKGTMEFTGATSTLMTIETANILLNHIKQAQENILFMRDHLNLVYHINEHISKYGEFPTPNFLLFNKRETVAKDERRDLPKDSAIEKEKSKEELYELVEKAVFTEEEKLIGYQYEKIINFYMQKYGDYERSDILQFLTQFAEDKTLFLYEGSLKIGKSTSEMTNMLWNLGFPIIQSELASVMNSPPFICKYTNANNSFSVTVLHYYEKIERTTGKKILSPHTIRVNRSGHVTYSGPDRDLMESLYYAFMKKIILNFDRIRSTEKTKQVIRIRKSNRIMSVAEWKRMILNEVQLREEILTGKVPVATQSALDTSLTPKELKEIMRGKRRTKRTERFDPGAYSLSSSQSDLRASTRDDDLISVSESVAESVADQSLLDAEEFGEVEEEFESLPPIFDYE